MPIFAITLMAALASAAIAAPTFNKDRTECVFDDNKCLPVPKYAKHAFFNRPIPGNLATIWTCEKDVPPRVIATDEAQDKWMGRSGTTAIFADTYPCGTLKNVEGTVEHVEGVRACVFDEGAQRICLPMPKDDKINNLGIKDGEQYYFCGQEKAVRMKREIGLDWKKASKATLKLKFNVVSFSNEIPFRCDEFSIQDSVKAFNAAAAARKQKENF